MKALASSKGRGQVPQEWRVADIRPMLKPRKNPNQFASYRLISLTSVVGKVMERLVSNRLRYFPENNSKLTEFQAGFTKTEYLRPTA